MGAGQQAGCRGQILCIWLQGTCRAGPALWFLQLPVRPTLPHRARRHCTHTAHLPCLTSSKTKESPLQGTGAWHPAAGNAWPCPPQSMPALYTTHPSLDSQEHVGVGPLPWVEAARLSLGVEVDVLPPKPGQGPLLSQLPILLTSSLRIPGPPAHSSPGPWEGVKG